eukprot:2159563-Pyramimonas_sp.AAC.1
MDIILNVVAQDWFIVNAFWFASDITVTSIYLPRSPLSTLFSAILPLPLPFLRFPSASVPLSPPDAR